MEQMEFDFHGDSSHVCPFCEQIGYQYFSELVHHIVQEHPTSMKLEEYSPHRNPPDLNTALDDPI